MISANLEMISEKVLTEFAETENYSQSFLVKLGIVFFFFLSARDNVLEANATGLLVPSGIMRHATHSILTDITCQHEIFLWIKINESLGRFEQIL